MGPVRLRLADAHRGLGRVLLVASKGSALTPARTVLDSMGSLLVEGWTPVLATSLCDSLLVISENMESAVVGSLHACQEVDLELSPSVLLMVPGGRVSLQAQASAPVGLSLGEHGGESFPAVAVSWRTLDVAVAVVDSSGRISAVGPGSTRIQATAGATRANVIISVLDPDQPSGPPLVARVTAGPDESFVSWAPPAVGAPVAVVWARRLGSLSWTRFDVPGGQTWRTLAGGMAGTSLEVMVALGGANGGVLGSVLDTVTVGDGITCDRLAGEVGAYGYGQSRLFCTAPDLQAWVSARGIPADEIRCGARTLAQSAGDVPNCLWSAGNERLLLLRGLGDEFLAPKDRDPALLQAALRRLLFGSRSPETTIWRPDPAIGVPVAETRVGSVTGYSRAVSWSTNENSVGSITYFEPLQPNGAIAIFHEGHGGESTDIGAETITWLLARGWAVVALNMPRVPHMWIHDWYAADDASVWRMLYGIGQVTEWIHRSWAPGRDPLVVAIGRSGGGWTTLLYGALDSRIDATVVVSGFEPLSQRLEADAADIGDWEQYEPSVFGALDYTDLVKLAASRELLVTYTERDNCCFRRNSADPLVQWLDSLGTATGRVNAIVSGGYEHGLSAEGYAGLDALLTRLAPP
jgi:hypothetical protein